MERSSSSSSSSSSNGVGLLAACAVSWSVAFLAFQAHKRMLSDFTKKMESQLNGGTEKVDVISCKKKVRFAEDVMEPSSNNKEYRKSRSSSSSSSSSNSSNTDRGPLGAN